MCTVCNRVYPFLPMSDIEQMSYVRHDGQNNVPQLVTTGWTGLIGFIN